MAKLRTTERKQQEKTEKQMQKQMQSSRDGWKRFDALVDVAEQRLLDWNCSGNRRDNINEEAELLLGLSCSHSRRESIKGGKRPRKIPTKNSNKKPKIKDRGRRAQLASTSAPQMPVEMQNKVTEIAGTPEANPIWVTSIVLFASDVSRTHGRLSLSKKVREVLTAADSALTGAMDVIVVDPKLKVWDTLKFNIWKSTMQYVLQKDWRKLMESNNLETGDTLHVWAFRLINQNNMLAFALNVERAQA